MDGWMDGCTDGGLEGWTDDACIDGWAHRHVWVDGRTGGRMDGRTERRKDGRTEGRTDGRREGRMDGMHKSHKNKRLANLDTYQYI